MLEKRTLISFEKNILIAKYFKLLVINRNFGQAIYMTSLVFGVWINFFWFYFLVPSIIFIFFWLPFKIYVYYFLSRLRGDDGMSNWSSNGGLDGIEHNQFIFVLLHVNDGLIHP